MEACGFGVESSGSTVAKSIYLLSYVRNKKVNINVPINDVPSLTVQFRLLFTGLEISSFNCMI
jgi:hypothetical protein